MLRVIYFDRQASTMSQMLSELREHSADELFACPAATSLAVVRAERDEPAAADPFLPAELLHGIEAVVTPTSPKVRSAAIAAVVAEIYSTVEWLHGGDADRAELASLAQVLAAARAHEARMAALNAGV